MFVFKSIIKYFLQKKDLDHKKAANYFTCVLLLLIGVPVNTLAKDKNSGNEDKDWRNASFISQAFSNNLPHNFSIYLSENPSQKAVYEVISRRIKNNQNPERILWNIENITGTKYFKLQSLKSNLYLVRKPETAQVTLEAVIDENSENAQWFIQAIDSDGGIAIFNRSGAQKLALIVNPDWQPLQENDISPVILSTIDDFHKTDHLFTINNRFLDVELLPYDIDKGTCLVYLPNGSPLDGFTTPSPSELDRTVTRYFRVSIHRNKLKAGLYTHYEFVDHLGFDPKSTSLTEQQQTLLNQLHSQIKKMEYVIDNNLNVSEVFQSFISQLSIAFNNDRSAAIVYFPDSLEQLELDSLEGKVEKAFKTFSDNSLALKVTLYENLSSSYVYAMLVKRTQSDGTFGYVLFDPTDTTKPTMPTG